MIARINRSNQSVTLTDSEEYYNCLGGRGFGSHVIFNEVAISDFPLSEKNKGASEEPVFIYVNDSTIEIRNADDLWGKTTWDMVDLIRQKTRNCYAEVASIGPAGENKVNILILLKSNNQALWVRKSLRMFTAISKFRAFSGLSRLMPVSSSIFLIR